MTGSPALRRTMFSLRIDGSLARSLLACFVVFREKLAGGLVLIPILLSTTG